MFEKIFISPPNRVKLYLPALLWASIIFILSSQPSLPGLTAHFLDYIFKKSAHMFEYAVLYILTYEVVLHEIRKPLLASAISFCICVIYAISDEYHQSFVSGRTATLRDVLYDTFGVLLAWLYKFKYI